MIEKLRNGFILIRIDETPKTILNVNHIVGIDEAGISTVDGFFAIEKGDFERILDIIGKNTSFMRGGVYECTDYLVKAIDDDAENVVNALNHIEGAVRLHLYK